MENIRLVRSLVLIFIVLLTVISAKDATVNAVFSIFFGGWLMFKIFGPLFSPSQDLGNLHANEFFPSRRNIVANIVCLLFKPTSRQAHIVIWWSSGILGAIGMYKLLDFLLISK